MGSLPRAKAGVGSAVNDTTRQVGGAVGVAVLGSVLASSFHGSMADKLASILPAPLLEAVKDNVGQAIGIARELPAAQPFAAQIVDAGNTSFVRGMHPDRTSGVEGKSVSVRVDLGCRCIIKHKKK